MEEENKIDDGFKKKFNLGYHLAKELGLTTFIFENEEKLMLDNPMHLGMKQYLEENGLLKRQEQGKSIERNTKESSNERRRGPKL